MKQKLFWSILFLLGLTLTLVYPQSSGRPESSSQVGRYQIVTVPGNNNEEAQAFKIDTVTGKTWAKGYSVEGGQRVIVFGVVRDYSGSPIAETPAR
jgi:hypothetical protein